MANRQESVKKEYEALKQHVMHEFAEDDWDDMGSPAAREEDVDALVSFAVDFHEALARDGLPINPGWLLPETIWWNAPVEIYVTVDGGILSCYADNHYRVEQGKVLTNRDASGRKILETLRAVLSGRKNVRGVKVRWTMLDYADDKYEDGIIT